MLHLGDLLPGGKGDDRPDWMFDPVQLARGIAVEREHTISLAVAKEIAKDHLTEDPQYYIKLAAIHLDGVGPSMEGWAKLLTVAAGLGLAAFLMTRAKRPRSGMRGALAGYYTMDPGAPLPIREVATRWAKDGDKAYDARNDASVFWYPIEDVLPFREYLWSRDQARRGSAGWDELVASMQAHGWTTEADEYRAKGSIDPAHVIVGRNGKVKVGEGNHRLAVAHQLGLKRVPVRLHFYREVQPSDRGGRVHDVLKGAKRRACV